jgi:hypothetical protein
MIFFQIIAWVLIVAAFLVLGDETYVWAVSGSFHAHPFGELWYSLNAGSLNGLHALVTDHISVWLWDSVIQPVLVMPAYLVLGVPGVVLRVLIGIRNSFVASAPRVIEKRRNYR